MPEVIEPVRHGPRQLALLLCAFIALTPAAATRGFGAPAPHPDARLAAQRHGLTLDARALAVIDGGETVVRLQPSAEARDVALIGVVRIPVARQAYMAAAEDFASWLRTPTRTRLGVFGLPPVVATLRDLRVAPDEARDLQDCRPGSCTTKLSAADMDRLRAGVDWSAPDVGSRVAALIRERLLALLVDYAARGSAALPVYDDKAPVRSADAFQALLGQSALLTHALPALGSYLQSFPSARPPGARDVLHWSEDSGTRFRPVLSLTHSVIWAPPYPNDWSLIVSRQLDANHYFEAALEVVSVSDRIADGERSAAYLVIERRFRFDAVPHIGMLSMRTRTVNGLRDRLQADLRREQRSWLSAQNR